MSTPPQNIDPECVPLCEVMNQVGLKTLSSCCGHGKRPFWVAFFADEPGLTVLQRALDGTGWKIGALRVPPGKPYRFPLPLTLESVDKGETAYQQAELILDRLTATDG